MIEKLGEFFQDNSTEQDSPEKNHESERPIDFAEAPMLESSIPDNIDAIDNEEADRPVEQGPILEDEPTEIIEDNAIENNLEDIMGDYFKDLREKSEYPETIPEKPFEVSDLEKLSPEEVAEKRDEFDDKKAELKRQWEEENGCSWPKYEKDIYSTNGKLIRKEGSDYDAHHIQPLGLNGKNEVSNITPLSAEVHYDKQGVHSPDSPYSKMDKLLGGMEG